MTYSTIDHSFIYFHFCGSISSTQKGNETFRQRKFIICMTFNLRTSHRANSMKYQPIPALVLKISAYWHIFCHFQQYRYTLTIFIDRVALAKQGDNALGSVRPSVCLSVCLCALSCLNHLILGARLCRVQQRTMTTRQSRALISTAECQVKRFSRESAHWRTDGRTLPSTLSPSLRGR